MWQDESAGVHSARKCCAVSNYADSGNNRVFRVIYVIPRRNTRQRVTNPVREISSPLTLNAKEAKTMAVNEKIRIKIKGYEHATVDAAAAKIIEAAKRSGSRVSGPIPLPTDKEVITVLRATHKYKDSREQFEIRTHKRLVDVIRPTQKTTEALQKLEIPAGVDIVMELK